MIINDSSDHYFCDSCDNDSCDCDSCDYDSRDYDSCDCDSCDYDSCDSPASQVSEALDLSFLNEIT